MTLNEKWLPIPGHEEAYEVSDLGRVRSLDRIITTKAGVRKRRQGRVLSPVANSSGRLQVTLGQAGIKSVHRLVLEAFIGPAPEGHECCHNDGNPAHNNLSNLRWASHSENMLDSIRHGTHNHAVKTHCLRGHKLVSPNLKQSAVKRGWRACLACSRTRSYVHYHPAMKRDFQQVSDSYYRSIMAQQTMDDYLNAA